MINNKILDFIFKLDSTSIPDNRIKRLNKLINYIKLYQDISKKTQLNFICTHNSRRSQFSQIWAVTFAYYFNHRNIYSFSGGTEVTETYKSVIKTLQKIGFEITRKSKSFNKQYQVNIGKFEKKITLYSKMYNCEMNPKSEFIAIMNCNDADINCPIIPGALSRFSLPHEDPKCFDGHDDEVYQYSKINIEIATSMKYLFKNI
jgi:arsenate reductase